LLQETWLSDINSSKISDMMPDFEVFHTSAMEIKLSSGFRSGRPFGGTAVLIRKSCGYKVYKLVTNSTCLSAVCCQSKCGNNLVFCSVYMPYNDGSRDHVVEYEAAVGSMQGILDRNLGCKFIFGGDLNITKYTNSMESVMVGNFCSANKLVWCDIQIDSDVNYTFHNDIANRHSMIDYFICSPDLTIPMCDVMILNDGDKLSDHFAIVSKFDFGNESAYTTNGSESKSDSGCKLQWEKADIGYYQSSLSEQLSKVVIPVHA